MSIYAVIDTNVIVSGLLTHNEDSPTSIVLDKLYKHEIKVIYNEGIISEYKDVLNRDKFNFNKDTVFVIINHIYKYGIKVNPICTEVKFIDEKDRVFYETFLAFSNKNTFLITGNLKHFPNDYDILSPREFIYFCDKNELFN